MLDPTLDVMLHHVPLKTRQPTCKERGGYLKLHKARQHRNQGMLRHTFTQCVDVYTHAHIHVHTKHKHVMVIGMCDASDA